MNKTGIKILVFNIILILIGVYLNAVSLDIGVNYDPQSAIPLSKFQVDENIIIPPNAVAFIDQNINTKRLEIHGELHCDPTQTPHNVLVQAQSIIIMGVLQCGKPNQRYNKKVTFSLKADPNNPSPRDPATGHIDPMYRGIMVHMGGQIILHGRLDQSKHYRLKGSVEIGQSYFEIDRPGNFAREQERKGAYNEWQSGDEVVIGTTSFNPDEVEVFTIIGADINNPNKYFIMPKLNGNYFEHYHHGEKEIVQASNKTVVLDERAEVALLSRNIKFQADEDAYEIPESQNGLLSEIGAHMMVHQNSKAYIDSVEFFKMGQAGALARYPFHWHVVGDAYGQYIKNSSIHKSFQRCITIHGTNYARVENNLCYDFKGHGIFLEDGNEVKNIIMHNLAMLSKLPYANRALRVSDVESMGTQRGRFHATSCYWISHPDNVVTHNIASGCHQTGFWMSFDDKELPDRTKASETNTLSFNHNIAHSNIVGMTWDGVERENAVVNMHYNPSEAPVMNKLVSFKNRISGIYFRSQTSILKDTLLADNGQSLWNAYNQIVVDSVIMGKTQNNNPTYYEDLHSTWPHNGIKAGVIMYDGPFEVHNTDFINFSTEPEIYEHNNGVIEDTTSVPFVAIAGARKLTNFTSGLSFSPEPYHRVFMYDESKLGHLQRLTQNSIRDLDGTLIDNGVPGFIAGKYSLGVDTQSNCNLGGTTFNNFFICPENYSEGVLNVRPFIGPGQIAGNNYHIVMRVGDYETNYPIELWDEIADLKNLTTSYIHNSQQYYKILEDKEYFQHQNPIDNSDPQFIVLAANSELNTTEHPIFEFVEYGNNCYLEKEYNGGTNPNQVSSFADLENAQTTSYFTHQASGNLFVKIIPQDIFQRMIFTPVTQASAYESFHRFKITCDNTSVERKVIGRIDNVQVQNNFLRVHGWSCNKRSKRPIQVQLFVKDSTSRGANPYTLISQQLSANPSEARVAFKCGNLSENGYRFEFNIPLAGLEAHQGKEIHVKGLSNTNSPHQFLMQSGQFLIPNTGIELQK